MSKAVITTRTADGSADLDVDGPDRFDIDNTGTLRLMAAEQVVAAFAPGQWLAVQVVPDTTTAV